MKHTLKIIAICVSIFSFAWFAPALWNCFHNMVLEPMEMDDEKEGDLATTIKGRFEQEFLMTRDPATNTIPRERLIKAQKIAEQKRAQMASKDDAIPVYWDERGPNNVGGRTRGILIDGNDPSGRTVWAAGVAGGLWRTGDIDAGAISWTKINDLFDNLAITTIAQNPTNLNTMYFGTGEGFGNYDAVGGLGIWRSMDGGANWTRLPTAFADVNKIVIDNAGTIYAATNNGLRRSMDNGNSWPTIFGAGNAVQDFEIAADGDLFATRPGIGVSRSQAGGAWAAVNTGLPSSNFGRVEIACAPNDATILYAAHQKTDDPNKDSVLGVFQSTNGGDSWMPVTIPALGGQSWYNLVLAVDPNNANRVWVGAVALFASTDAGANWTGIGIGHSDQHAIVYRPGNSNDIVFGCDGGVYRTTNGAAANPALTERNTGYNVTQFLSNALHPSSGSNYMLGGTQDNGTQKFTAAGLANTSLATGGDGAFSFIDQDNPNVQITSFQNRQYNISTNGGASFGGLLPGGDDTKVLFIAPSEYDNTANILYYSDTLNSLGRISDVGGANTNTTETYAGAFGGSNVSAVAVAPLTANQIIVGTTNGRIVRVDNANMPGATTATVIAKPAGMPASYISCIEMEPGNDNHWLVIFSNFGVNSVWETPDGGATWVDLDDDLPDMPIRWAMFNPFNHDQVMLATELGIWSTDDLDGVNTQWWPTNTFGLANVRVDMLQYRSSDHLVAAATHGRGMFTTDYFTLLNTCTPSLFVGGAIPSGLFMAEDFINASGVVSPGGKVIMQAGDFIDMKVGFWAQQGSDYWALIRECNISPAFKPTSWDLANSAASMAKDRSERQDVFSGKLGLNCYPNPTTYRLFVTAELPEDGVYSLYVRNIQGRMIKSFAANDWHEAGSLQFEVDAESYAPGLYVLTLQTSKNTVTEKFIVAR